MIRLSDILKKYKEGRSAKASGGQQQEEPAPVKPAEEEKLSLSAAMAKEESAGDAVLARDVYEAAVAKAKEIYSPDLLEKPDFKLDFDALIERIVGCLGTSNKELLQLCLAEYPKIEDYLYFHVVDVVILCLDLGLGLGLEEQRLHELGIAAFIHDIGEVAYLPIINKKGILSKAEFNTVKEHPQMAVKILSKILSKIDQNIIDATYQEHERLDGSGYPRGLKEKQISEFAQIIGLADVYEAMIHQRPYRTKYTPLETVKSILHNKEAFDCRIIKTLIERIGIFPLGIMVRLNTKETGVVVRENTRLPLRPVVKMLTDVNGKQIKENRFIDLAQNPVVFIEESMECAKG